MKASCQRAGSARWNMPSSLGPKRARISVSVYDGPPSRSSARRNVTKQIGMVSASVPSRSKMAPAICGAPVTKTLPRSYFRR